MKQTMEPPYQRGTHECLILLLPELCTKISLYLFNPLMFYYSNNKLTNTLSNYLSNKLSFFLVTDCDDICEIYDMVSGNLGDVINEIWLRQRFPGGLETALCCSHWRALQLTVDTHKTLGTDFLALSSINAIFFSSLRN